MEQLDILRPGAMPAPKNRISFESLRRMLVSDKDWERWEDQSYDHWPQGDMSDEEYEAACDAERDEWETKRYDAVIAVTTKLFEEHGLMLEDTKDGYYDIEPQVSWEHAARQVIETINGVGYFRFDSLDEFLDSGPYTAQSAVLHHLGWIKDWPEVYGEGTARGMFDRELR